MLCKKIISLKTLKYPHFNVTAYQVLSNIFYEYKFNNSIFTITLNNAKNNNKVVKLMLYHLSLLFTRILFHMRCTCRIINLVAKDGLNLAKDQIRKIIHVIAYI